MRNSQFALYLAKPESIEGTDPIPTAAANPIELLQPIAPDWDFAFKNPRPRLVKGQDINAQPPLKPAGQVADWSLQAWFRGLVSAPTALNPIEVHPWFMASGYAATYSGAPGAEQVAYSLASNVLGSLTDYYYEDGILVSRNAVRGELTLDMDVGGPLVVGFQGKGRVGFDGTGAAVPVPANAGFKVSVPPVAVGFTTFSIDGYNAGNIRKFSYKTGNAVQQKTGMLAPGGIAAYRVYERAASWSVALEAPVVSDKDLRALAKSLVDVVVHWTLPAALYQSFDFLSSHAKIEKATASLDNGEPIITIEGGVYDVPEGTPVLLTVK